MNHWSQLPGKYQHHLLCVDDEEPRLLLTVRILQSNGYQVTACSNPLNATQIFEQENIELAVTDDHMPGMNGARLAAQLRNRCPEVRVVLFTGALRVAQSDLSSADAVVHKSDRKERLLETVENLLATPANSTKFPRREMSAVRA